MLGLALLLSAFLFQTVDRTAAPPVVPAAGIAVEQLMRLPEIDGREWIEISPAQRTISATSAFGAFTLTVEPMPENGGDVVRHRVVLAAGPGSRVTLDPGNAVYAWMSADARWILIDPLDLIDLRVWRRYRLGEAFKLDRYIVPRAISADGQRLLISQQDCPYDCSARPRSYEIRMSSGAQ